MQLSVILPVRNCERTVVAAVQSVIEQSFRDWELIVIDDGSDDSTLAQLKAFRDERIRVIRDGLKLGLPVRLNEGIAAAAGEFVARMDGDDVCFPMRFERQLGYLRSNPDLDLVGGGMLVFGEHGRAVGKRMPPVCHQDICRRPYSGFPMAHPTFLGRTSWFRKWKFRATAGGACDQDLLLRAFRDSRFANVPEIVLGYREHAVMLSKCLKYRMEYAGSLFDNHRLIGLPDLALGLALIVMKATVDSLAVCSGLQHSLLQHRAMQATDVDLEKWRQVSKHLITKV